MKSLMMSGVAAMMLCGTAALAQPYGDLPPGADPDGYYSRTDQEGYYDRSGQYHRFSEYRDRDNNMGPPPPRGGAYYREGQYEQNCRDKNDQNKTVGTIFGALAGGLIGNAASHGNGGAVVGGAILGGLLGNTVSRDIPCEDHPYAFQAYATGLNGDLGHRYEWRHGRNWGYFVPQREFYRDRRVCRTWTETTYRGSRSFTRSGTACRFNDGNWHFDD